MPKYEKHAEKATADLLIKGFRPIGEYKGSQQPWEMECLKCGFQFTGSHFKIRNGDLKNCPKCRENMKSVFAAEARNVMLEAGLTPQCDYPGRNSDPWPCTCNRCGAEVSPAFANVKSGGGGCIFCGIRAVSDSKRLDPYAAHDLMLASNLRPLEPYESASKAWKCECLTCGAQVSPTFNAIQQGEGGCRTCGRRSAAEKTKLDSVKAVQLMRSKGYEPLEPYANSQLAWKCRCLQCERIVSPSYSNVSRRQQNFGCIFCMGGRVSEEDAIKVMKSSGVIPIGPYPGKDNPWVSKCVKCEREVKPTYANARRGQGGCKFCSEHGIDLSSPAYLYVLQHSVFNAYKVGIGKSGGLKSNDRIRNLGRQGWTLLRKYEYSTGLEAQTHESSFFQVVRNELHVPIYLSADDMKRTAGHTETMDADSITATKIFEIIEMVRQIPSS